MSSQTPINPTLYYPQVAANSSSSFTAQDTVVPQAAHYTNMHAHGSNYQASDYNAQQAATTPPRTPRRNENARTVNARTHVLPESASKPKSKGKNRQKHTTTSPAIPTANRNTPPLTGQLSNAAQSSRPVSTPSAAAYAGPTFHASPAPSALPIPSFFSKSVPDSPGMNALLKAHTEETSVSGDDSPIPQAGRPAVAVAVGREESPLDFIFNAHREESRARSASGSNGPFDLPLESPKTHTVTQISEGHAGVRSPHFSGGASSSMFAMELDGNASPGKPYGAAFSTPYSERISAARSSGTRSTQALPSSTPDKSQALKDFLFSQTPKQLSSKPLSFPDVPREPHIGQRTTSTPLRAQHNSYPRAQDHAANTLPRASNRSSGLRREMEVTPTKITPESLAHSSVAQYNGLTTPSRPSRSTPTAHNFSENALTDYSQQQYKSSSSTTQASTGGTDLRGMEDSLRRILKLEPSSTSSTTQGMNSSGNGGLGNMPSAAASVPNYVGGRAPPMNGLHNGVLGS